MDEIHNVLVRLGGRSGAAESVLNNVVMMMIEEISPPTFVIYK